MEPGAGGAPLPGQTAQPTRQAQATPVFPGSAGLDETTPQPAEPQADQTASDQQLSARDAVLMERIRARLGMAEGVANPDSIEIQLHNGRATLSGSVPTWDMYWKTQHEVERSGAEVTVDNQLQVTGQ